MDFIVQVRHKKRVWDRDKKGKMQECHALSRYHHGFTDIQVSLELSPFFNNYLIAVVHEIIHEICTRSCKQLYNVEFTERSEHQFIEKIEKAIVRHFKTLKKIK